MKKIKILGYICARLGSSRLPGKMLMDIAGKPAIQCVYDRLSYEIKMITVRTWWNGEGETLEIDFFFLGGGYAILVEVLFHLSNTYSLNVSVFFSFFGGRGYII